MTAPRNSILHGDALTMLKMLPDAFVQCCITSPPYYALRSYLPSEHPNKPLEIGTEETPEQYIDRLAEVFREVRRVLRPDGVAWVNIGDSYAGSGKGGQSDEKRSEHWQPHYVHNGEVPRGLKPKDLIMIPFRFALALQADGWYIRQTVIWQKPNCLPESVQDRPTTSHEYVFLLAKRERYYYDAEAIKEDAIKGSVNAGNRNYRPYAVGGRLQVGQTEQNVSQGRNKRSVWSIPTTAYPESHFAVMPSKLVEPCILAGSRPGDIILDPFAGAGTVLLVAIAHHRDYLGIELNEQYITLIKRRIAHVQQGLWDITESEVSA